MILNAVLFDLHGTLAYVKNPITSEEVSNFLLEHGYEAYPQSLDAAFHFVSMVEYPRYGYKSHQAYLKQALHRLDIKADLETLKELAALYQQRNTYTLFPDAASAVLRAKQLNLKTAIVTTIASFKFHQALMPIRQYLDIVMTGYEAGCEKSNPKMHMKTLEKLDVTADEAVMIGDSLLVDIQIPKKLGMHTILLDRQRKISSKPLEADAKTSTLVEALDQIEQWKK